MRRHRHHTALADEQIDAVVLTAGRLRSADAVAYETAIKALVRIGAGTPLQALMDALRGCRRIQRVIVVGPTEVKNAVPDADVWIDELSSGAENALAGLARVESEHALVSASDLPFVEVAHIDDLLKRVESDSALAYPIYERREFLKRFPGGRTRFARVGGNEWTGGSMCWMDAQLALRHQHLIRKGFQARKNPFALASLFGPDVTLRYLVGRIAVHHVERRLSSIVGGKARAIFHADPALAMDCDEAGDIEYARWHVASK